MFVTQMFKTSKMVKSDNLSTTQNYKLTGTLSRQTQENTVEVQKVWRALQPVPQLQPKQAHYH